MCRQEADEHDRAMNALEVALDDARSHARSKEQKLLVISKELKASGGLTSDLADQTLGHWMPSGYVSLTACLTP